MCRQRRANGRVFFRVNLVSGDSNYLPGFLVVRKKVSLDYLKQKFPHHHICHECALRRGGVLSPGVATAAEVECKYCNGDNQKPKEMLLPWIDYDWPEDRKADYTAKASRD